MPTREKALENLHRRGEFVQLLREARTIRLDPSIGTSAERALVAHALASTGEVSEALSLLRTLSPRNSTADERILAHIANGVAREQVGDHEAAENDYRAGAELARLASHSLGGLWAQLHRFRLLVERQPVDIVAAMLPDLRRAALRSGDPSLIAYLHMCIVVFEGQTGRLEEAHRHCGIVEAHLASVENSWLHCAHLLNKGCLFFLDGNLGAAREAFEQALPLAARTGDPMVQARIATNLAHVHLQAGNTEAAIQLFRRTLESPSFKKLGGLGALDGLARAYLTGGDYEKCQETFEEIDELTAAHTASLSMYHFRWVQATRARFYLHSGRPDECLAQVRRVRADLEGVKDAALEISLTFTAILASSKQRDLQSAAAELLLADRLGARRFRDLQPQFYFVSGQVCEHPLLAKRLRKRADRLWNSRHNVAHRRELGLAKSGAAALPIPEAESSVSLATADHIVNALAAMFDLASSPRQLGEECLALLSDLRCAQHATIVERDALESNEHNLAIGLGKEHGTAVSLICERPKSPSAAQIISDVFRVIDAAVSLEELKRAERLRCALWPASSSDSNKGPFFVSETMQDILGIVKRVADSNFPVLITGETGTGKEVVARTIHACSSRAEEPFVPFNCSATPREMLDAQLFGHRRGAFTGANEHSLGIVRGASGGTLFLDEIGEVSVELQPKLLRFLESAEVHPIGETKPVGVDVRVIAATNADIDALVATGRFREDLFYRLNILRLNLPPLRSRREEIPVLAQYYLERAGAESGKHNLRLAEETVDYLVLFSWPGNVRQLVNEMRRVAALADSGTIVMPGHLSSQIVASRKPEESSERVLAPATITLRIDQPIQAAVAHLERAMIGHALEKSRGRLEESAALLGLSRKGLYLKRQRYGLDQGRVTRL